MRPISNNCPECGCQYTEFRRWHQVPHDCLIALKHRVRELEQENAALKQQQEVQCDEVFS